MIATAVGWIILVLFLLVVFGLVLLVAASMFAGLASVVHRLSPIGKVPFKYTLRNAVVRWKNTLATMMAFILVISLLTALLAFVGGMYRLTESSGNPLNVVIMSDGATDEAFSNLTPEADVRLMPKAVQEVVERTKDGKDFMVSREVYVIVNQPIPNAPKGGKQRRFIQMRGIGDPKVSAEVHGLELAKGGWWTGGGSQKVKMLADGRTVSWLPPGAPTEQKEMEPPSESAVKEETCFEIVLGDGVARELANDRPDKRPVKPGDVFDIGGHRWVVVGITSGGNSTFGSEVWAKDTNVGPNFGKGTQYTTLVARVKGTPETAVLMTKELKNFQQVSLAAQTETEYYSKLGEANKQFFFAILALANIMALAGALGVMVAMFAAISQRQKDIGVLRLLGYTRGQILMSFLFESILIGLVGGAIGLAIGYFLVDGQSSISNINNGQGGGKTVMLKMVVANWVILTCFAYTLIMGSFGGFLPALSAMRLKPLESLR